jgi:hypothetical protein
MKPPAEPPIYFVVMSGIALPSKRDSKIRADWSRHRYPFDKMAVGQSFDVHPGPGQILIKLQNHVSGAASGWCKTKAPMDGYKFTTRQINGALVRCWRVK